MIKAPPGVDTGRFTPAPDGWRSAGYILSVCRLTDSRKGLDRVLRGYKEVVLAKGDAPKLVLAGRGVLPEPLGRLIIELGLSSRILIQPDVEASRLPELYRGASVYLQASHEEGLGISVLEAMASGLPVVCSVTAGTNETVVNGETGWLVHQEPAATVPLRLAGQVIDVLQDSGQSMAPKARTRAVHSFSQGITLARFTDLYDELLRRAY